MTKQAPPDWYTASEAAALLGGKTTRTLANWADQGLLHPMRGPAGRGHRRYPGEEVRALARRLASEAESLDTARQPATAGAA